jgi:protein-S-isoprenylcysteine O-methyltransferase Ste14
MFNRAKLSDNVVALDVIERIVVAGFYSFYVWRFLTEFFATGNLSLFLLIISEGSIVVFIIFRRFSSEMTRRPTDWLLGVLGTTAPLFAQPSDGWAYSTEAFWILLMLVGILFSLASKFTLRRSFGIVAANRGVKANGPYRLVRHPMYAGYILTHIGFLVINPTAWNTAVYLFAFVFQIGRILAEERVLDRDPRYQEYASAVRFRLLPGVF